MAKFDSGGYASVQECVGLRGTNRRRSSKLFLSKLWLNPVTTMIPVPELPGSSLSFPRLKIPQLWVPVLVGEKMKESPRMGRTLLRSLTAYFMRRGIRMCLFLIRYFKVMLKYRCRLKRRLCLLEGSFKKLGCLRRNLRVLITMRRLWVWGLFLNLFMAPNTLWLDKHHLAFGMYEELATGVILLELTLRFMLVVTFND